MIAALLLAAAQPTATNAAPTQSAIDAERAFAADAHKLGQWTAFRKWAAADAIMFLPQAGSAQAWLKDKANPPVAVFWWPGRSYVSCDGNTAINTGPWVRQWGKSVGYFTTVWRRQPDGSWKWVLDHGDALPAARAEGGDIKPSQASCSGSPKGLIVSPPRVGDVGGDHSADRTLVWRWSVSADGGRTFEAWLWNGQKHERVVVDEVKAE